MAVRRRVRAGRATDRRFGPSGLERGFRFCDTRIELGILDRVNVRPRRYGELAVLWVGTFCVGTEVYAIAGIAPRIVSEFGLAVATTGVLIGAAAFAYAASAPLFARLLRRYSLHRVVAGGLGAFALFTALAGTSLSFGMLLGAHVAAALAAAVFSPAAYSFARSLAHVGSVGKSLSTVSSGITTAVALGVPVATFVASRAGWRDVFLGIAALAGIAALCLLLWRDTPREHEPATTAPGDGASSQALYLCVATVAWAAGGYCIYPFIATIIENSSAPHASALASWFLVFGVAGVLGGLCGGWAADFYGRTVTATTALLLNGTGQALISVAAVVGPVFQPAFVVAGLVLWGFAAWAFYPALQALLVTSAHPTLRTWVLSVNASMVYLGMAIGSFIGAAIVAATSVAYLGAAGALFELLGVAILLFGVKKVRAVQVNL
jgi:predicted MFS family arabinose efflux permease